LKKLKQEVKPELFLSVVQPQQPNNLFDLWAQRFEAISSQQSKSAKRWKNLL